MLAHLVAEDLDLAVCSVDRFIAAVVIAVRVDLNHQGKSFHALLGGEICTQAIHGDENLKEGGREGGKFTTAVQRTPQPRSESPTRTCKDN